jgi:hypothetical protein
MAVSTEAPIGGQTSFQTSVCSEMFLAHSVVQNTVMAGGGEQIA